MTVRTFVYPYVVISLRTPLHVNQGKMSLCKCLVFKALGSPRDQDRIVQKPVNADPGLKLTEVLNFKLFLPAYVLIGLRFLQLKTEAQTIKTENVIANCKIEIKIRTDSGLVVIGLKATLAKRGGLQRTSLIFSIVQLILVKTRYPLTSIT